MQYDFTSILDRRGKDAIAVDIPAAADASDPGSAYFAQAQLRPGFDQIPMWVADMNFPVVPTIQQAIAERVAHPAFGYFTPREEYFEEIIRWHEVRNGVCGLKKEHIGYENGVLGGVVSALNVLCSRGDSVLLHAPTYIGFTNALGNNGYHMVLSFLKPDAAGIWRMDLEDMEQKIVKYHIHAAVFCSPHNPTGRVWERAELEAMMELFRKYDVYVISDEIWSDLILEGYRHIPLQSISEDTRNRTIAFYAPSKTFNLAGLVGSYHIIYNRWLRERMKKESSLSHYNSMNVLSMYALIGALQPEGYEWVDQLCHVLTGNVRYACDFIREHFEGVRVADPQGTYMLFLDCEEWCRRHGVSIGELQVRGLQVGVLWQDGRPFHGEYGIRMNLALPFSRVQEALDRLNRYVFHPDADGM